MKRVLVGGLVLTSVAAPVFCADNIIKAAQKQIILQQRQLLHLTNPEFIGPHNLTAEAKSELAFKKLKDGHKNMDIVSAEAYKNTMLEIKKNIR